MITAKYIKTEISGSGAEQKLYELSEKVKEDDNEFDHIIISAVTAPFSGPETYIFPANKEGEIIDYGELSGSYRGGLDHDTALND